MEKIDLDFHFLCNKDPKIISVYDTSQWSFIENKPSVISILPPAFTEEVILSFKKGAINTFNSVNLGLNCGDCPDFELNELPDGVYEFTLIGSPSKYQKTRKYLRTTKAQLELDELFIKLDILVKYPSKDVLDKLIKIDFMLRSAEANIRYDNVKKSQDMFFEAQRLIKELKGCKSCF